MYVELHAHSAFSFLDGASLPDELAAAAVELGYEAMALTDHNGVSGSMEFAQAAAPLGLRAIHGAELDLADGRHVTVLVEDERGWRNLCHILTLAHAHTRGTVDETAEDRAARHERRGRHQSLVGTRMRRVDVPPETSLATLAEHAAGLVCLSGCAGRGVHDEAGLRALLDSFGRDHLWVELQRPFQRDDRARNRALAELAVRLGLPAVATGNVHVHARERAPLQDAFTALRHHTTLDASEPVRRGNFSHVLASPEAMAARFPEHPEAVAESGRLAARLRFDLCADLGYRYPGSEDEQALGKLTELCWVRLGERYPTGGTHTAEAQARLEQELRVIDSLGLAGFFLLHRDLLELARDVAVDVRGPSSVRALLPPGRGRGSSVSSIVCYLTGLSHIDPITNELFLGRFLNEDLTALPDIDLDFPRDIREVLIPRVHERYGRERSALVAAFPTFRSRGAIRELGKALGLPAGEIERVARGAEPFAVRGTAGDVETALGLEPGGPPAPLNDPDNRAPFAMSTEEWLAMVNGRQPPAHPEDVVHPRTSEARYAALPGRWGWLARLCDEAYGLPRHLSQHSGGMIVSTRPLIDCCPVLPAAMEGRQLCQWDKDSCADAGFLKIDLLGLGMLSAVERCVELIERKRGERIDLSRIPFDDKETYAAIQEADTMGVFQIESRAQMQSLYRTRPESLDDLTIQVAIVRPGPILGGAVNPYIARRQRMREDPDYVVPYDHPSLEPVLRDTLGTIIFQDQVIEVAMAFAGFSPGEAEGLRRAMSRKRSAAAIEAYHQRFLDGAMATHGVDEETAERVYTMIVGFSGFGFPKAHGAAFGLLAYQSTWLRVHHAPEFLCALLNEQPMGFYAPDTLAHEAQRRGIELAPPNVNASEVECTVETLGPPARVRIGLGYVLGVRRDEVEALVATRRKGGPFRSLADLASRAGAGRPSLEKLAWAGACDALATPTTSTESSGRVSSARRAALWQLGVAAPGERVADGTQLALPLEVPAAPELRALNPWEGMVADYATTGLTLGPHPLALLRPSLTGTVTCRDLENLPHEARIRIGGLVVARQRPGTAKGIVFILLEDEFGTINLIVPPPVYERHRLTVRSEPLILAEGRLEKLPIAGGAINVYVRDLRPLVAPEEDAAGVIELAERRAAAAAAAAGAEGPDRATAPSAAAVAAGADFRGVAPAVQSFASGRRR
ncbi:MAG TPA: DNA polymerase III subunit alpha [Solirubrobacteraceae bacterium]|jgi:error-prone DNA polymerase|nr:DNA polymerase III subunit alpha [Solirubrobacteraceae bacterium]